MAEVPMSVIRKLIFFTVAMITFPLTIFFALQMYTDNMLVCGGAAALAANIVLVGYLIVAFTEELPKEEEKKEK